MHFSRTWQCCGFERSGVEVWHIKLHPSDPNKLSMGEERHFALDGHSFLDFHKPVLDYCLVCNLLGGMEKGASLSLSADASEQFGTPHI